MNSFDPNDVDRRSPSSPILEIPAHVIFTIERLYEAGRWIRQSYGLLSLVLVRSFLVSKQKEPAAMSTVMTAVLTLNAQAAVSRDH